ncbi:MAG: Asp-tRNA(Asn)/Glu-tRNA(Gln) amidotransferase subunit GatA [Nitrospinota bacterium]|nr:Asp-tRNA(Asn)/Glu-tRNA(Gln) amidotransferase subunit GatA [Nitrospinota bacterium]
MKELLSFSIAELSVRLKDRSLSSEEVTKTYLERIKETEDRVHAYLTVLEDDAIKSARIADKNFKKNDISSPLQGIPIAIKDLLCMKGTKTTAGSKILENFTSPYDATAVSKLKDAGAVILGKLNMDEFAMGSSCEHSAFGPTHNPWKLDSVPGGSSGGSAASVAAHSCIASLGSDTGGSIRQPAACCGVVGMKPTYGRVSRYGLIAFASSLDQIGPLTRNVEDCAIILSIISGHDSKDSTSSKEQVPNFLEKIDHGIEGMKIGIPDEYFIDGMDPEIKQATNDAIKTMENLGAEIINISLPHTKYALPIYYIIAPAEASSNLSRYDGVRYGVRKEGESEYGPLFGMYSASRDEGFGKEVKRRIMLGTYALSSGYYDAYYTKALKARTLVCEDFIEAFSKIDLILSATTPTPAFKLGERLNDPLSMYLSDILTIPCNIAGLPGISIQNGITSSGLPMGLQLLGKPFDEEGILKAAYAFEKETKFYLKSSSL